MSNTYDSKKKRGEERKTDDELRSMPAHRLLAYYAAVRARTNKFCNSFFCECCGEGRRVTHGKLYTKRERDRMKDDAMAAIAEAREYRERVKAVLSTKEHAHRHGMKKNK